MNYHEFLLFAVRRLKLKFPVVEFCVRGFLRKHHLTPRTLECYLLWDDRKGYCQNISRKLKIDDNTVWRHLQKLEFICPELFVTGVKIPAISQMYFPDKREWEEIERLNQIREVF